MYACQSRGALYKRAILCAPLGKKSRIIKKKILYLWASSKNNYNKGELMIPLNRKELKKWNFLWIFIVVIMALQYVVVRLPQAKDVAVAHVDGTSISLKDFRRTKVRKQLELDMYAMYFGQQKGRQVSDQEVINFLAAQTLFNKVANENKIVVDEESYKKYLAESVPRDIISDSGEVQIEYYREFVSRQGSSILEYEEDCREEMLRGIIRESIEMSSFLPLWSREALKNAYGKKKSFMLLSLPFSQVRKEVTKEGVSLEEMEKFYEKHKEKYRAAQTKDIECVVLDKEVYLSSVEIEEQEINDYYERNKERLYKKEPQVSVRIIKVTLPEGADEVVKAEKREKAEGIRETATKEAKSFDELAKAFSEDEATAKKGGLIEKLTKESLFPQAVISSGLAMQVKGEISPVIVTKEGFYIIYLENRIEGGCKDLSLVKGEIEKTLKTKKAEALMQSEVQAFSRQGQSEQVYKLAASNNPSRLSNFTLKEGEFSLKSEEKVSISIQRRIANSIFGKRKQANYGCFKEKNSVVFYKVTKETESYLPSLDQVKEKVEKDALEEKAKNRHKKLYKEVWQQLIQGSSLEEAVKLHSGLFLESTPFEALEAKNEDNPIKKNMALARKAYDLETDRLILKHLEGDNAFFISLREESDLEEKEGKEYKAALIREQEEAQEAISVSFVASLQKNATITINKSLISQ